ncbi:l-shaped tail fiber protein (ltf protein) [Pseudomonas amygdali pv. tabaci str. ATCC 11528]|uniref:tail fiber domain-containing protein n=1 Tax=Pseudomonas amygdali TaxID=47877 RepID=UPI00062BAD14|nr:tail fiber domain-containing protein [Pseudomonas amygdali]KKY51438.1 l-shaped tail fiber protein (ltf protein) [Pseudomonas amygdali pv. tabaci str. ATCC 11528]
MPWHKAGTVSVTQNSNAVIGTNTAFIANSRVGDGFRGPDGGWYEVTNVASDTAISISPNYQGATSGAGGYAIAPLQGYVKESADRLRALVLQYGDKLAALGTTGNYDILPVAKGGTGANSADNAVSSLGFMAGTMYPKFGGAGFVASAGGYNLQGGYIGWNTGGSSLSGSMNFICNRGGGVGGFTWQSVNADNTQQGPAMTLTYAGALAVPVSLSVPRIDNLATTTAPLSISPTASNSSALNASLIVRGAPIVNSWARLDLANTQLPAGANLITYLDSTGLAVMRNDGGGSIEFWTGGTRRLFIGAGGVTQPGQDNTYSVGSGSIRYTTAFLSSGAISTSDAREKTPVRGMSESEIAAAKDLAKEIGFYQFLSAVEEKGADARQHCGMTVQRAIEVMRSHGLEPMNYSFICHNEWEQETREHPAQYEQTPVFDAESGETTYEKGDLKSEAWTEVLIEKGDRYSFRSDGLLTFIASGFEARLAALEAKV